MKTLLIITINFYLIFSTYGRLLSKTTAAPIASMENVEDIKISKEEKKHDYGDYFKLYNKKVRTAKESTKIVKSKNISTPKADSSKTVLVKKPIPKFNEDSDEDYLIKMRMPSKLSDTVEHEDEDFNVDDYDFDINHDEFAGRGKPLEPRTKIKVNKQQAPLVSKQIEYKPKNTVTEPAISLKPKNIVPRKVADKMKEEEYDDEFPEKKTTESSNRVTNVDEDNSDENDDSSEYNGSPGTRTIRSPWSFTNYVNKLGEKTSAFMSRILSILPIFPQQPVKKLDEDTFFIKDLSAQEQRSKIST